MSEMKDIKKIYFITGGGTGGHIYPALAVANALKNEENSKVYYIGNPEKPEARLTQDNGIEFLSVNISSMPRKISINIFAWIIQLSFAVLKSMYYICKYKPSGVFATGGYVSAPILFASIILKIPFMMHDGDVMPGIVTRKISPFATCVSGMFDDAQKHIKNKNIHITGNPIRKDFSIITKEQAKKELQLENKLVLLVMGGSQGAKSLNESIIKQYQYFSEKYNLAIIHQTGKKNYEEAIEKLEKIYPEYKNHSSIIVKPYFDNMPLVMKASDIAISRAGSLSISELCASQTVPVLVPYPYAAANHQLKNADCLAEKNAAFCVEESEKLCDEILQIVEKLVGDVNLRTEILANSSKFAKPYAAETIINLFKGICK